MKTFIVSLFALLFSIGAVANDTGAWFDPAQDGHGISLYDWDEGRTFWWFAHDEEFGQIWLMSSVETGEDFILYIPTSPNASFPVGSENVLGDPVGTATLVKTDDGRLLFTWDILVEELTCLDKYGPVPPGPIDPLCRREDGSFDGSIIFQEGYDFVGSSRFVRLTPEG